jgi:hypothetical protein
MKFTHLKKTTLLLASLLVTTSAYAYNKDNAKHACINKVTEYGSGKYHGTSNIHVTDQGHHSYSVTGNVRSHRDKNTHHFSCSIRHKELVNYHVSEGSSSNKNSAADIGVGILALAVVAAAANKHNDKHKGHDSGASPFGDMHYLKRQCKQNIRHQISRDRRPVSKIKIDEAHLHNRKLKGTGYVIFKNGHERDLTYSCNFDRRGNIYDGYYHFRRR